MATTSIADHQPPRSGTALLLHPPVEEVRPPRHPSEWRQVSVLLQDFAEWIRAAAGIDLDHDQPGFSLELADLASTYEGTRARMFVAFENGLAMGTVAIRFHDDGTAELKRMYVRRAARGSGIADRLVDQVVASAADRGCRSVWLETVRGAMDRAISLYERHGFVVAQRAGGLTHDDVIVMQRPLA
jgi:putative acetyltransferase